MPAGESSDFDILRVGSCRSITRAPAGRTVAFGHDEGVAVAAVEADGEVAGELDVLALVVADRHLVGVVEEDVGGHERRVGEQAAGDEPAAALLGLRRLVLELGHAPQLADRRGALHQPGQLAVLVHVALDEHDRHGGIDADGQERRGQAERSRPAAAPGPGARSGRGGRPRSRRPRGPGRRPSGAGRPGSCPGSRPRSVSCQRRRGPCGPIVGARTSAADVRWHA